MCTHENPHYEFPTRPLRIYRVNSLLFFRGFAVHARVSGNTRVLLAPYSHWEGLRWGRSTVKRRVARKCGVVYQKIGACAQIQAGRSTLVWLCQAGVPTAYQGVWVEYKPRASREKCNTRGGLRAITQFRLLLSQTFFFFSSYYM